MADKLTQYFNFPRIPEDASDDVKDYIRALHGLLDELSIFTKEGGIDLGEGGDPHDHGNLNGLNDDDHTQYLLTNGTRELSGNWGVGGTYNITGVNNFSANKVNVDNLRLDGNVLSSITGSIALAPDNGIVTINATIPQIHAIGGDLWITSDGGNIEFSNENLITTGGITSDELTITHPTVDYKFSGRAGYLTLTPITVGGASSSLQLYSGDIVPPGAFDCYVAFYAVGSPNNVDNYENIMFGFSQAAQRYQFRAHSVGNGVQHPIHIWATKSDTDQLYIDHVNGRIGIQTTAPAYILDVNGTFRAVGNGIFGAELDITGAITFNHVDSCNGLVDVANDDGMSSPGDDTKVVSEQAIINELDSRINLGSDIIVNGDFATDTDWTYTVPVWSISGGDAVFYAEGEAAPTYSYFYTDAIIPHLREGSLYLVEFKITDWVGEGWNDSDGIAVRIGAESDSIDKIDLTDDRIRGNGVYKHYFTYLPFFDEMGDPYLFPRLRFSLFIDGGGAVGETYGFHFDYVTVKKINFFEST